jgi:PIN domain nuclease of toxin-antitoxin system
MKGDHRDPTDRIAIAQAIEEKIPIISSDRQFHDYKRSGLDLVFNKR